MILYVNGDSHAAGAEAAVPHSWAKDDEFFWGLGQRPHPDNERVSFGCELANQLYAILQCDAQAGGSNARIIRTTREWIHSQDRVDDIFVVIQWSTWEREEWLYENQWWQVNASGIDHVPHGLEERYKKFILDVDWRAAREAAHEEIWQFHQELKLNKVRHVMFNGNNHFGGLPPRDWGTSYIGPYDPAQMYDSVLRSHGFTTVSPESWHFGADAHCFWGNYLLQYINNNQLLNT